MRCTQVGAAAPDVRCPPRMVRSPGSTWILEALVVFGVWPRSACERADAAQRQMGGNRTLSLHRVRRLGGVTDNSTGRVLVHLGAAGRRYRRVWRRSLGVNQGATRC